MRIVRSGYLWPKPAPKEGVYWTGNCTCPKHGLRTGRGVRRPEWRRGSPFRPSPGWPKECWSDPWKREFPLLGLPGMWSTAATAPLRLWLVPAGMSHVLAVKRNEKLWVWPELGSRQERLDSHLILPQCCPTNGSFRTFGDAAHTMPERRIKTQKVLPHTSPPCTESSQVKGYSGINHELLLGVSPKVRKCQLIDSLAYDATIASGKRSINSRKFGIDSARFSRTNRNCTSFTVLPVARSIAVA